MKSLSDSKCPSINMAASTTVGYRAKDGGFQHLLYVYR
jgi:flagellar basal body rod protein FlgG